MVRALPTGAGGTVPVVAFTAYGSADDRAKTLSAGFVDHLAKPLRPDELLLVIAASVRTCDGRPGGVTQGQRPAASSS